MLISDYDLYDRIETEKGDDAAQKFGDCLSDIPEHETGKMIQSLNKCLKEIGMTIEVVDMLPSIPDGIDSRYEDSDYILVCVDKTPVQHHPV